MPSESDATCCNSCVSSSAQGTMSAAKGCGRCCVNSCKDFGTFIAKGNVVDLAVAVVIGTSFTDIVKSLANDVIMPLFGALTGNPSTEGVTTLYFTINNQKILIGNFFGACLTFLMLAALCFYLVILPFMTFMKFFEKKKPVAPSRKCPECKEAVALDAVRCKWCCICLDPMPQEEPKAKVKGSAMANGAGKAVVGMV